MLKILCPFTQVLIYIETGQNLRYETCFKMQIKPGIIHLSNAIIPNKPIEWNEELHSIFIPVRHAQYLSKTKITLSL